MSHVAQLEALRDLALLSGEVLLGGAKVLWDLMLRHVIVHDWLGPVVVYQATGLHTVLHLG